MRTDSIWKHGIEPLFHSIYTFIFSLKNVLKQNIHSIEWYSYGPSEYESKNAFTQWDRREDLHSNVYEHSLHQSGHFIISEGAAVPTIKSSLQL